MIIYFVSVPSLRLASFEYAPRPTSRNEIRPSSTSKSSSRANTPSHARVFRVPEEDEDQGGSRHLRAKVQETRLRDSGVHIAPAREQISPRVVDD